MTLVNEQCDEMQYEGAIIEFQTRDERPKMRTGMNSFMYYDMTNVVMMWSARRDDGAKMPRFAIGWALIERKVEEMNIIIIITLECNLISKS